MNKKLEALQEYLKELGSVAIAFSSGVDSTFLLKVAHDVLGDQVIAVTAQSCSFPKRELEEAKAFCKKEGIKHIICESEEVLQNMAEGEKLIGIISHVTELKQEIEDQLIVTKDDQGSHTRWQIS